MPKRPACSRNDTHPQPLTKPALFGPTPAFDSFGSFPMFYAFDEWPQQGGQGKKAGTSAQGLWDAAVNSMGAGMLILCLLDFVRLAVGSELTMKG